MREPTKKLLGRRTKAGMLKMIRIVRERRVHRHTFESVELSFMNSIDINIDDLVG